MTTQLTQSQIAQCAREIAEQPMGSMVKGGNWPEDEGQVGGCECFKCGGIFMGGEWRFICKRCDDYEKASRELSEKS